MLGVYSIFYLADMNMVATNGQWSIDVKGT